MLPVCTGLTAFWCPVCGDCTCQRGPHGDCFFDDNRCPLHSDSSRHAENQEHKSSELLVEAMEAAQDMTLTDHDRAVVTRFAQLLKEKSRLGTLPKPKLPEVE